MAKHEELGEWYDSSRLSLFHLCPRRYFYRYVCDLVPLDSSSVDLSFGTAIHTALECLYLGDGFTYVPCPHRYLGDEDCDIHLEDGTTWNLYAKFLENFPKRLEGKFKTQTAGIKLLSFYIKKWKTEPFKVIAVEQPFVLPIEDEELGTIHVVGKIDLLVDYEDGTGRMPLDHKTPGRVGQMQEAGYRFDLQLSTYIKAVTSPDQPLRAGVINNLHPAAKITEGNLFRYMTTRQEWDLKEWEEDIKQTIREIHLSEKTGHWRKHSFACHAYMRECEYYALCLTPPDKREALAESLYKKETWEPF